MKSTITGITSSFTPRVVIAGVPKRRPEVWNGKKVPDVLLSGHHKKIAEWRLEQSVQRTKERRPDLYEKYMEEQRKLEELNPKKKRNKRKKILDF